MARVLYFKSIEHIRCLLSEYTQENMRYSGRQCNQSHRVVIEADGRRVKGNWDFTVIALFKYNEINEKIKSSSTECKPEPGSTSVPSMNNKLQ